MYVKNVLNSNLFIFVDICVDFGKIFDLLNYFELITIFMFTDQLYYTLKRLNKSERSRYKVDLYWILLGCAQHNNRSVLLLSAQATQMGYPTRTSSKHPTLGPKGINATQDIPTVPPEAHNASSKPRNRHKSSPEPVLKFENQI